MYVIMVKVPIQTTIESEDFIRLEPSLVQAKKSIYTFAREAIIEKMQREGI